MVFYSHADASYADAQEVLVGSALKKNGPENLKNQTVEGVWELLGAILRRKILRNLSWLILVSFGRARIDQNLAQRGQDGGKLEPR